MICQVCKGLSSPQRCDQFTHSRAPLDSTYQDHTFALSIPLELDDDDVDSLKLEHLSWSCLLAHAWWRLLQNSPIHQYGRNTLRHIFTLPQSSNRCQASSIWYLHVDHLEVAPHNLDVDHHMTPTMRSCDPSWYTTSLECWSTCT